MGKRKWLREEPFQLSYALSRLTPGTNLLAFMACIGYLLRRFPGAVVTLLAGSIPCSAMAIGLSAVYEAGSDDRVVIVGTRGALAAAVAVMLKPASPSSARTGAGPARRRAEHPRAKGVVQAVILASAGLLWAAALPIGTSTITDPLLVAVLIVSVAILLTRKVESLWVILGSAAVYLTAASLHLVAGL